MEQEAGSQAQYFSQKLASPAQGQPGLQAPTQVQGRYWGHICGQGVRVAGAAGVSGEGEGRQRAERRGRRGVCQALAARRVTGEARR